MEYLYNIPFSTHQATRRILFFFLFLTVHQQVHRFEFWVSTCVRVTTNIAKSYTPANMSQRPSPAEIAALADVGTLSPLPLVVKRGIVATSIFGLLSFISCALLFIYITYKLLRAQWAGDDDARSNDRQFLQPRTPGYPLDPVLTGASASRPSDVRKPQTQEIRSEARVFDDPKRSESHSFLTLIHNILMADMVQAASFMLSATWWRKDGIFVPSPTCTAQAFTIALGSNSICFFLIAISMNTFFTIVWGYKFSAFITRVIVVVCWTLALALAFTSLGLNFTMSGENQGWYYARSLGLCWTNRKYAAYGLWLQNFWIVLSIGVTVVCYGWTFVTLLLNKQSSRHLPQPRKSRNAPPEPSGHHPAFLIYPMIYVICAAPITFVGMAAAAGVHVALPTFASVSVVTSMVGVLDAILWSFTILFSTSEQLEESGLDKFTVRTPDKRYGHMVWVEGPTGRRGSDGMHEGRRRNWWRLGGTDGRLTSNPDVNNTNAIHLDTVMTVTVERDVQSDRSTSSYEQT